MIINKLEIMEFGKFRNKTIEFNDDFNVIVGKNEAGKSTVIDFIYAMLYGFGEKRGSLPFREKCIPWDGTHSEGKLTLTLDDKRKIIVYRKTGETKKSDIFKVFDVSTGAELNCNEDDISPTSSSAFLHTLCIKQLSSVIEGTDEEIMQRLSDMAVSGEDGLSCDKAIKTLKDLRRDISPRGGSGLLDSLKKRYDELLIKVEKDEERRKNLYITQNDLKYEKNELEGAEKAYKDYIENDLTNGISSVNARIDEKQKIADTLFNKKSKNINLLFLTLSILSAAVSIFKPIVIPVSIVLILYTIFIRPSRKSDGKEVLLNEIESLKKELEKLNQGREIFKQKRKELFEEYEAIQKEVYRLEAYLGELNKGGEGNPPQEELIEVTQKLKETEDVLSAVNVSLESLEAAKENMHKSYTPKLSKLASNYLSILTNSKYNEIFTDEGFNIYITRGIPRKGELFSGGTIDQMYFALRLAITDMLFPYEKIFLILDQPFIQYDAERKKCALKLLDELSSQRQILLFSDTDEGQGNILIL